MSLEKALIVDDSKSARVMLSRLLSKKGLEVDLVESADEAFDYLGKQYPDIIFMDHMMPGTDGLTATRRIANDPKTAQIPIVMYTSKEDPAYLEEALETGALGVLPKPAKSSMVDKVLDQVKATLKPRSKPADAAGPEASELAVAKDSSGELIDPFDFEAEPLESASPSNDQVSLQVSKRGTGASSEGSGSSNPIDSEQFWGIVHDKVRDQVNDSLGSLMEAKLSSLSAELSAKSEGLVAKEVEYHFKKHQEHVAQSIEKALDERIDLLTLGAGDEGSASSAEAQKEYAKSIQSELKAVKQSLVDTATDAAVYASEQTVKTLAPALVERASKQAASELANELTYELSPEVTIELLGKATAAAEASAKAMSEQVVSQQLSMRLVEIEQQLSDHKESVDDSPQPMDEQQINGLIEKQLNEFKAQWSTEQSARELPVISEEQVQEMVTQSVNQAQVEMVENLVNDEKMMAQLTKQLTDSVADNFEEQLQKLHHRWHDSESGDASNAPNSEIESLHHGLQAQRMKIEQVSNSFRIAKFISYLGAMVAGASLVIAYMGSSLGSSLTLF